MTINITVPRVELAQPFQVAQNLALQFFQSMPKQTSNVFQAVNEGLSLARADQLQQAQIQNQLDQITNRSQMLELSKMESARKNILGAVDLQKKQLGLEKELAEAQSLSIIGNAMASGDYNSAGEALLKYGAYIPSTKFNSLAKSIYMATGDEKFLGQAAKTSSLANYTKFASNQEFQEVSNSILDANGIVGVATHIESSREGGGDDLDKPQIKIYYKDPNGNEKDIKIPSSIKEIQELSPIFRQSNLKKKQEEIAKIQTNVVGLEKEIEEYETAMLVAKNQGQTNLSDYEKSILETKSEIKRLNEFSIGLDPALKNQYEELNKKGQNYGDPSSSDWTPQGPTTNVRKQSIPHKEGDLMTITPTLKRQLMNKQIPLDVIERLEEWSQNPGGIKAGDTTFPAYSVWKQKNVGSYDDYMLQLIGVLEGMTDK